MIATHLPYDEIRGLRELFESIDTDGSGTLTAAELQQARRVRAVCLGRGAEVFEAPGAPLRASGSTTPAHLNSAKATPPWLCPSTSKDRPNSPGQPSKTPEFPQAVESRGGSVALAELQELVEAAVRPLNDSSLTGSPLYSGGCWPWG